MDINNFARWAFTWPLVLKNEVKINKNMSTHSYIFFRFIMMKHSQGIRMIRL